MGFRPRKGWLRQKGKRSRRLRSTSGWLGARRRRTHIHHLFRHRRAMLSMPSHFHRHRRHHHHLLPLRRCCWTLGYHKRTPIRQGQDINFKVAGVGKRCKIKDPCISVNVIESWTWTFPKKSSSPFPLLLSVHESIKGTWSNCIVTLFNTQG